MALHSKDLRPSRHPSRSQPCCELVLPRGPGTDMSSITGRELQMQTLGPRPRPPESEPAFNQMPRWFSGALRSEMCCCPTQILGGQINLKTETYRAPVLDPHERSITVPPCPGTPSPPHFSSTLGIQPCTLPAQIRLPLKRGRCQSSSWVSSVLALHFSSCWCPHLEGTLRSHRQNPTSPAGMGTIPPPPRSL